MENPLNDLARRLFESLPASLRSLPQDLESNFRAVLRANLSRLDLVSRDEFDAQARVLERTRAKLEGLEARLAQLEAEAAAGHPDGAQPAAGLGPTEP